MHRQNEGFSNLPGIQLYKSLMHRKLLNAKTLLIQHQMSLKLHYQCHLEVDTILQFHWLQNHHSAHKGYHYPDSAESIMHTLCFKINLW